MLAALRESWDAAYSIALGGTLWVDVTRSNKAIGLQAMCEKLSIDPSEVMAFGDNFNDVEMLRLVGVSYAMEHSHPDVKVQAKHICRRVEPELEKFLLEIDG
jgi:hydroxymethylpyrimidine pyrophosphatase-like HAD family hydrolase